MEVMATIMYTLLYSIYCSLVHLQIMRLPFLVRTIYLELPRYGLDYSSGSRLIWRLWPRFCTLSLFKLLLIVVFANHKVSFFDLNHVFWTPRV